MPTKTPKAPRAATLSIRLAPEDMRRLTLAAEAMHQPPESLAESMIRQQLAAIDLAQAPLAVLSAPELAGMPTGSLLRSEAEPDARYAARAALFGELLSIPDP